MVEWTKCKCVSFEIAGERVSFLKEPENKKSIVEEILINDFGLIRIILKGQDKKSLLYKVERFSAERIDE